MIRLGGCPSWSESSLGLHAILLVLSRSGSYHATFCSNTLLPYLYKKLIYIFAFISFIIVVLANIHVVSLYLSMVQYCSRHYWTVKLLMFLELCGFHTYLATERGSSIGSMSAWHTSGPKFNPHVWHILSWRLGHEKIPAAILPLPLIQEEQLSVTGGKMCTKYW